MDFYTFKQNPRPKVCWVKFCRKHKTGTSKMCAMHKARKWRFQNPILAAFHNLKHHAKQRKKVFTLTLEDFSDFISTNTYLDDKGITKHSLHIDRKDETKGYEIGNIRTLSCSENVTRENIRRKFIVDKLNKDASLEYNECPF